MATEMAAASFSLEIHEKATYYSFIVVLNFEKD
jgi:hypothetical protein